MVQIPRIICRVRTAGEKTHYTQNARNRDSECNRLITEVTNRQAHPIAKIEKEFALAGRGRTQFQSEQDYEAFKIVRTGIGGFLDLLLCIESVFLSDTSPVAGPSAHLSMARPWP